LKHVSHLQARPPLLDTYCKANPAATDWEAFKKDCRGGDRELLDALTARQRNLCAFCEIELLDYERHVEHWRPKRLATPMANLTFDVVNLAASCENLTKAHWYKDMASRSGNPHPGPNLSCGPAKGGDDPQAQTPRPYDVEELPVTPSIFSVGRDGTLSVNTAAAAAAALALDRLEATIDFLKLNCTRLKNARKAIMETLDAQFDAMTTTQQLDPTIALSQIAAEQVRLGQDGSLPSFITTLRSYCGIFSEVQLASIPDWAVRP
jgi:uncharacterized protein (TIGR02646 family)